MFAAKAFAIASLILAGAKALDVSTPDNVVQCGDTQITISGATGQYHVSVVPAENSCESDSLFESGALNGGSYTWKANVPAGTQAMFVVDDDSGNEAWSGAFTVGAGDASCLNASSSASSTSSAPSSTHAYASAPPTKAVVSSDPATPSSTRSVNAPINAQQGNTPATNAAFFNTQASLSTILTAMGVVAMAL